jgi:hypothetical protein
VVSAHLLGRAFDGFRRDRLDGPREGLVRSGGDNDDGHVGRTGSRNGWETPALGHVLRYEQRVEPIAGGSRVAFGARVDGPLGSPLTALARPLSAFGQRRRLARLGALAEFEVRRGTAGR